MLLPLLCVRKQNNMKYHCTSTIIGSGQRYNRLWSVHNNNNNIHSCININTHSFTLWYDFTIILTSDRLFNAVKHTPHNNIRLVIIVIENSMSYDIRIERFYKRGLQEYILIKTAIVVIRRMAIEKLAELRK